MTDKNKLLRENLGRAHRPVVDSAEKGEFTYKSADGGTFSVRDMAGLRQAVESGAGGRVLLYGKDGGLFDGEIENLTQWQDEDWNNFKLATGPRAVKDFLKSAEIGIEERADNKNFFDVASRSALGFTEDRNNFEQFLSDKEGEVNPVASTVGPAALATAAALPLSFAAPAAGAGLLARGGFAAGQLATDVAATEGLISANENREFSSENVARDFLIGAATGGAGVLAVRGGRKLSSAMRNATAAKRAVREVGEETFDKASDFSPRAVAKGDAGEALDAAASVIETGGGDVSKATILRNNKKALKAAPAAVKQSVAKVQKHAQDLSGVEKHIRKNWEIFKGSAKAPKTALKAVQQPAASLASKAEQLAARITTKGDNEIVSEIASSFRKLEKLAVKKKLTPAQLQEQVNSISSNAFGAIKRSEAGNVPVNHEVRELAKSVRALKHDPAVFGEAAEFRKSVDEVLTGLDSLAPALRKGDVEKFLGSNTFEGSFQVHKEATELVKALSRLEELGVVKKGDNFLGVARQLENELNQVVGSRAAPGPLRLMQYAQDVADEVSSVRTNFASKLLGKAGGALGGAVGGVAGVKAFGALGALGAGLGRNIGRAVGETASGVVTAGRNILNAAAKTSAAALKNPKTAGPALGVVTKSSHMFSETKREDFDTVREELTQVGNNPEFLAKQLEDFADVAADSPDPAMLQALSVVANANTYLYEVMPGKDGGPVSDSEVDQFMGKMDVITDPFLVLKHLEAGTLDSGMVEALSQVYPELYAEMGGQLVYNLGDDLDSLDFSRKVSLSRFLRAPIDPSLSPTYISVAQNRGAQTQQQDQTINGQRNSPLPNQIAQMQQTTAERLANK